MRFGKGFTYLNLKKRINMTTVQDLIDWCDAHDRTPENTEIFVYANSALGNMPAKIQENGNSSIFLDYC